MRLSTSLHDQRVHAALAVGYARAQATQPPAPSLREQVTAKLGLPSDATNEQVFAALNAIPAKPEIKAHTSAHNVVDMLAAKAGWISNEPARAAYESLSSPPPRALSEKDSEALAASAWGRS